MWELMIPLPSQEFLFRNRDRSYLLSCGSTAHAPAQSRFLARERNKRMNCTTCFAMRFAGMKIELSPVSNIALPVAAPARIVVCRIEH